MHAAVDAMGNDGRRVHVFDCRNDRSALVHKMFMGGGREDSRASEYGIERYRMLGIQNAATQREYHVEMCRLAKPLFSKTLRNIRLMTTIAKSHWMQQCLLIITSACEVRNQ